VRADKIRPLPDMPARLFLSPAVQRCRGLVRPPSELATKLSEDPIPVRQARPPRRGFVMTDGLMLFLALLAAFTVVLVEWWARRTP
jgi:hypothetical protein